MSQTMCRSCKKAVFVKKKMHARAVRKRSGFVFPSTDRVIRLVNRWHAMSEPLRLFVWITFAALQGYIVLYCIVLYCIVLYCIVLYCIVLYCIVLYCIVLYCIVLDWIGLDWIGLDFKLNFILSCCSGCLILPMRFHTLDVLVSARIFLLT